MGMHFQKNPNPKAKQTNKIKQIIYHRYWQGAEADPGIKKTPQGCQNFFFFASLWMEFEGFEGLRMDVISVLFFKTGSTALDGINLSLVSNLSKITASTDSREAL